MWHFLVEAMEKRGFVPVYPRGGADVVGVVRVWNMTRTVLVAEDSENPLKYWGTSTFTQIRFS